MEEKFYEIIDRPSSEVNKIWKAWHLFFISICIGSGLFAAIPFAVVKQQFSETCFLYPNISYTLKNLNGTSIPSNVSVTISPDKKSPDIVLIHKDYGYSSYTTIPDFQIEMSTRWGDEWICQYVQFVPLISLILGSVLAAFFLMYPRGGTSYSTSSTSTRAWHLVVPSIIVSFLYSIVVLVSLLRLSNGLAHFCEQFIDLVKPGDDISTICAEIMTKVVNDIKSRIHGENPNPNISPHSSMFLAILATTVCLISWLGLFVSLILRVINVADFKILEITVKKSDMVNVDKNTIKSILAYNFAKEAKAKID